MKKSQYIRAVQAVVLGIIIAGVAYALLTVSINIDYSGTINTVNVKAYSDEALTQVCTSIDAGAVYADSVNPQTIYIANEGTVPLTLSMTVVWGTAEQEILSLTWNQEDTVLNAGTSVPAVLTLTVPADTQGLTSFSAQITITGTEL